MFTNNFLTLGASEFKKKFFKSNRTGTNFEYSIYRKPSQTNLINPNKSNHPPQHKIDVYKRQGESIHNICRSRVLGLDLVSIS